MMISKDVMSLWMFNVYYCLIFIFILVLSSSSLAVFNVMLYFNTFTHQN
jgi:hypothetical protein